MTGSSGAVPEDAGARVREFHARLDAAQAAGPPSRDGVRRALRHHGEGRPPVRLRRLSVDIVLRHGDLLADLFRAFPDDVVHVQPYDMSLGWQGDSSTPLDPLTLLTTDAAWQDEWGTGWAHAVGGSGASPISAPLADWGELERYLLERLPDPAAPGRLDGARPMVEAVVTRAWLAGTTHQGIWERYNQLRGMEQALIDLARVGPQAERLLDALTEYQLELLPRWRALGPLDAIFLTDDWGTQSGLMCSPATWLSTFAPRYRRICERAHELGLDVVFHSCGDVHHIVGGLVDVGVDVIDPIQPEAMDLAWLARQFGGSVAFAGGIGMQRLPMLTPGGVRDSVLRLRDLLAAPFGNSLIVAPANSLLADIPAANLVALFEACHSPA